MVTWSVRETCAKERKRAGVKPSGMAVRAHLDTAMPEGLLLTFPELERVGRHCATAGPGSLWAPGTHR